MEENKEEFFPKVLTANMLKVIAIIAMTIDHLAWLGYDYYPQDVGHALLHCIGRLTAPIIAQGMNQARALYCFLITAQTTKDAQRKKA